MDSEIILLRWHQKEEFRQQKAACFCHVQVNFVDFFFLCNNIILHTTVDSKHIAFLESIQAKYTVNLDNMILLAS